MNERMAEVELVPGGGTFTDEQGQTHFIKGYGGAEDFSYQLDPRLDLTAPLWSQLQKLNEQEAGTSEVTHAIAAK